MSGASPSPPDSSLDEATEEGFILVSNKLGVWSHLLHRFFNPKYVL